MGAQAGERGQLRHRGGASDELACIVVIVVVAAVTFRGLYVMHSADNWQTLAQISQSVLDGTPYWRAYQNRLLGPAIIAALDAVTRDYGVALQLFNFLGLLAQNLLLFALARAADAGRAAALLFCCLWSLAFLGLQDYYFYPWDILDILILTFFAFSLVNERWLAWSVLLYPVALLNRESALFLPLGLVLLLLARISVEGFRRGGRYYALRFTAGVAAILAGAAYTKFIRDVLFVTTGGDTDPEHRVLGNHVYFGPNLHQLLVDNWGSLNALVSLLVIGGSLWCVVLFFRNRDAGLRAGYALFLAMVYCVLMFGMVNEARLYIPLVSLFMFLVWKQFGAGWQGGVENGGP